MSLHEKLRELYHLDQQVRGLRGRLDAALRRLDAQQTRLQQFTQQRDELRSQHRHARADAMQLEMQTKEIDEKVARFREQMNQVRTNKEYQALLLEVSTLKNDKSKLEDDALGKLARVDELEKQAGEMEGKALEQQKLVALAQKEVGECRAEIGQQLDTLTAQRDAAERELPAEAQSLFQRASRGNDGEAMAAVVEESRRHKEYSCGGCYIAIPIERVSALMRQDELVCCPNCGRILYLDQDLKSSMGVK